MTSMMTGTTEGVPRVSGLRDDILEALRAVLGRGASSAGETLRFRLDEDEVLEQLTYGRD